MRFFQVKHTHNWEIFSGPLVDSGRRVLGAVLFSFLLSLVPSIAVAQRNWSAPGKLPSAERIVGDYVKAIGGKKRLAAIADATYDWSVKLQEQTMGVARTQIKAPVSVRTTITFGNGIIDAAANTSSAWERGLDGKVRTLTGAEADAAKLQAILDAGRLLNYKRLSVLARVVTLDSSGSEPAHILEFSMRNGSHLRYSFSAARKLLLQITDEARKTTTVFSDYRAENNVLEPHRKEVNVAGTGSLTFLLEHVKYNTGVAATAFDPPRGAEALDIPGLMREVSRNQDVLEERTAEYAFTQKETTREINDRGEIKKETVRVYEVFPIANRDPVNKLISEDGVPLSAERVAKEDKRVQDELVKAEKEGRENKEKRERQKAELAKKRAAGKADDDDPGISQFLRACEFVSPRRERFRDRDAIVFDFRPRADFHPANRAESLISKLVGVIWIDPIDRQVMRMEARLAEGFKVGGGVLVSLQPGAAMVMEQTRMEDGVWLPRLAHFNLSIRVLLFGGGQINKTYEWSDYKHFKGNVDSYKLESPPGVNAPKPKP
jgi:hypothetical protein